MNETGISGCGLISDTLRSGLTSLKKPNVLPPRFAPYGIAPSAFASSSTLLIGVESDSMVRKAARFAVYEETMISVKNHHIEAMIRVEGALRRFNHSVVQCQLHVF